MMFTMSFIILSIVALLAMNVTLLMWHRRDRNTHCIQATRIRSLEVNLLRLDALIENLSERVDKPISAKG